MGTHNSTSSSSIISGVPQVVSFYEDFGNKTIAAFREALEDAAKKYQAQVREQSATMWGSFANNIKVTSNDHDLSLSLGVPPEHSEKAHALEYGVVPQPALRMAALNAHNELATEINAGVTRRLL